MFNRLISVNFDLNYSSMIEIGKYDFIYPKIDLDSWFSRHQGGIVEFETKIFCPKVPQLISTQELRELISQEDLAYPWQAAQVEHLLAFGAAFPEDQRKNKIIALGSIIKVEGVPHFLCLDNYRSQRNLMLTFTLQGSKWMPSELSHSFLGVRPLS